MSPAIRDTIPSKKKSATLLSIPFLRFWELNLKKNGRLLDNDGIDLTVRLPQNRLGDTKNPKPGLDIQMKSTSSPDYDASGNYLNFDLKKTVYEKMRGANNMNPTIFMILILPKEIDQWVSVDSKSLEIQHNVLWYNPADDKRDVDLNSTTVRLKIPTNNIVDKESLYSMFKKSADDILIKNEVM